MASGREAGQNFARSERSVHNERREVLPAMRGDARLSFPKVRNFRRIGREDSPTRARLPAKPVEVGC